MREQSGFLSIVSLLVWLIVSFQPGVCQRSHKRISMESTTQTLQQGKSSTSTSEIFVELPEGKIINFSKTPEEFIYISNPLGEAQIYYPRENKVMIGQNEVFSSKNHSLYYFLTNQTFDMGLRELKFSQTANRNDGSFVVSTWQAPLPLIKQVDQVDLVYEGLLLIYSEYRNTSREVTLKIYYSDFQKVFESMIPGTITEIIFTPDHDSIVRRTRFDGIRTGNNVNEKGFLFKIPENATVVK